MRLISSRCLLCDKFMLNEQRHVLSAYYDKGHFNTQFSCPECIRQGIKEVQVKDCQQ